MAPKDKGKGKATVPSESMATRLERIQRELRELVVARSEMPVAPMETMWGPLPGLLSHRGGVPFSVGSGSGTTTGPAPISEAAGPSAGPSTTEEVAPESGAKEKRPKRGVIEGVFLMAKWKVAMAVGLVPAPMHKLEALEQEYVEAARQWAYLQHAKDRAEVLERHLGLAKSGQDVMQSLPIHSPVRLGALGSYLGLKDLAADHAWRKGRPPAFPPTKLQLERACQTKKKVVGLVHNKIVKLTSLLEAVVTDDGEEFVEVREEGEEEEEWFDAEDEPGGALVGLVVVRVVLAELGVWGVWRVVCQFLYN
ncbi:hypothetical protein SpCBS45565_g03785 [Spizellomyces sp. 'palustris']|nr:hypothetical protein SpCBS45565_g03785 [Spizellomyces sp. 'palustris']